MGFYQHEIGFCKTWGRLPNENTAARSMNNGGFTNGENPKQKKTMVDYIPIEIHDKSHDTTVSRTIFGVLPSLPLVIHFDTILLNFHILQLDPSSW